MNSQQNINRMHAKWILFLQKFTFIFHHKAWKTNRVADTLSWHISSLATLKIDIKEIESIQHFYSDNKWFYWPMI